MANENQPIIEDNNKCPVCGSTRRFAGQVGEERKKKGLMRENMRYGLFYLGGGPVIDMEKVPVMLVGSKVPAIRALVDVCMDCWAVFCVRREIGEATFTPPVGPQGPIPPGPRQN